jgi:hypothetical protein
VTYSFAPLTWASFVSTTFPQLPFSPRELFQHLLPCNAPNRPICASPAACLPASSTDDDSSPGSLSSMETSTLASSPATQTHSSYRIHHFTHSSPFPPASAPTTSPHNSPLAFPPSGPGHQSITVYIFMIIGGIVGLILIALCTRQAVAYSRLPRHNTVMTVAEREQLVEEMAGYVSRRRCESYLVAPPPPYEHAPSYESLTPHESFWSHN